MQNVKKELVLLTGTKETRKALFTQLNEIMSNFVQIHSYSLEEGIPEPFNNQLVILSTHLIEDEVNEYIGHGCQVITAKRTINYENIDSLFFLPTGTQVLYVNDFQENVFESIQTLKQLGIDHIDYVPYYPGAVACRVDIAVTPGEKELVPNFISRIIDIGPRLIDITTLLVILDCFGLLDEKGGEISEKYTRKIIELSKKLAQAHHQSQLLNEHLHRVLNGVNDGILAVNDEGMITVFNEKLEDMLKMKKSNVLGRFISEVLRHTELVDFILRRSSEENSVFMVQQTEMIVHRFHIEVERTIVVTFKNARETIEIERSLRRELVKKGYVAKFHLSHIVGKSPLLQATKRIAQKLARTEMTVLIQGESGTGKEMFASTIHNESKRCSGPFLAVNFSALPEELVESELFGYEEGAFTGAKKGGKPGLFEQAHGGTIFLDEIGDISLKLQARLLRVLQEKEIMRIGGSKIIPVDVRIIAATNKDLLKMIDQGKFREDLYHRLKVAYLHLPALRQRAEDIPELVFHFIREAGRTDVEILPEVIQHLTRYEWYGNIRELKNTIDYMLAVCEDFSITKNDIPNKAFFQENAGSHNKPLVLPAAGEELLFILQAIHEFQLAGEAVGRKKISELSHSWRTTLSEQQIRHRLNTLEQRGLITKSKGRGGTKLTPSGFDYLSSMNKAVL